MLQTGSTPTTAVTIGTDQVVTFAASTSTQGITVGRGGGAVSTNTAVGASALAANTTGGGNQAFGVSAGAALTTGNNNTALGRLALATATTPDQNTAVGYASLYLTTTGQFNTAVGGGALQNNTTASYSTAVGYQALYTNTGERNTALGSFALYANTTGTRNAATSYAALNGNTTGSYNTASGYEALASNTTASYNTALGYQAGYSQTTTGYGTFLGQTAGYATTGISNTFVGQQAGALVTSGAKNTIVGRYDGNQGGLDIRTSSNKVVLSDGDGVPVIVYGAYPVSPTAYLTNSAYTTIGVGGTGSTGTGALFLNGEATSGWGPVMIGVANGTYVWQTGSNSWIKGGTTYNTYTVMAGASGGVNLTSGATSWASASDERLKNVTGAYTNALADIAQIQAVKFTWKSDEEAKPCVGVIAQSVQPVVPEAIETIRVSKDDETDYLSVKYTELIPLLIASIQELKAEFDAYKEAHP